MNMRSLALLGVLALLAWVKPAQAAESYDNCTGFITSLPAVVSNQGTWCLNKDLSTAITSGNAITVNASNVTINCNDFKVGGLAAGANTGAIGIYSNGLMNITVRRCNVRGFLRGIWLSDHGDLIEDNRLDNNTFFGIELMGDGAVARNRVSDTGGSPLYGFAYGIAVGGDVVDVIDNTVNNVFTHSGGTGNSYGIQTMYLAGGSINGNRVRGVTNGGTGHTAAIYLDGSPAIASHATLRDNDLIGTGLNGTVEGTFGIYCVNAGSRAIDNVIQDFDHGIFTCGDAGGNDITP